MRFQRASPLLLLLGSSLVFAAGSTRDTLAAREDDVIARPILKKDSSSSRDSAIAAPRNAPTKPFRGTEAAPVDGQDGKPHLGPFVDVRPEQIEVDKIGSAAVAVSSSAKTVPSSLAKLAKSQKGEAEIPEKNDGVMDDVNRITPKKGTTGTEGGITEKEKERRLKTNLENKPQAPVEAPPLPHSEQKRIEEADDKPSTKSTTTETGKSSEGTKRKSGDYGSSGLVLEKPADLPESPHASTNSDSKGSTIGTSRKYSGDAARKMTSSGEKDDWLHPTMPYTEGHKTKAQEAAAVVAAADKAADADAIVEERESWHEWIHSFGLSFTMILFSEIGDKTFLVAALMAMRHPRLLVFSAALGALAVMTVLSAVLGHAVPTLLPQRFTTFAAAILFLVFGARMLREGMAMPHGSGIGEEMKEVEAELEEQEHSMALDRDRRRSSNANPYSLEAGRGRAGSRGEKYSSGFLPRGEPSPPVSRSPSPSRQSRSPRQRLAGLLNLCSLVLSPAWVQTFVMTFLGEWGDRSQIATIAMAAGQDYWWVTLGAIAGHALCTGLAVIGGRALAGRVSMRVVTIGGALAFLVFGVIYLFECMSDR